MNKQLHTLKASIVPYICNLLIIGMMWINSKMTDYSVLGKLKMWCNCLLLFSRFIFENRFAGYQKY